MVPRPAEQPGRDRKLLDQIGVRVGIGVVCYVEGTGIGPYEGAKVLVQSGGKHSVATGSGTQRQGHYTAFAQIAAEHLVVVVRVVQVVT